MTQRVCLVKKLYENATPYIQVLSYLVMIVPLIYTAVGYIQTVNAYDDRLAKLEKSRDEYERKIDRVSDKLDLIIRFLKVKP